MNIENSYSDIEDTDIEDTDIEETDIEGSDIENLDTSPSQTQHRPDLESFVFIGEDIDQNDDVTMVD